MANSSTCIVGNLTSDPELRFTPSGQAVCNFQVAVSERYYDTGSKEWKDRDPNFYRVNAWRQLAENVTESLRKGNRVIVWGDMRNRSYETQDGETRYTWELEARSVGAELSFASAEIRKAERSKPEPEQERKPAKSNNSRRIQKPTGRGKPPADADPWEEEPPF